ncbi:MAG: DEAD/DEAH box helicase family protein [Eubacteriales bacterium]
MAQSILKFKGNWRNYQKRVLSRFSQYKQDGKIHIVAAPGSGKTTLGIELIGLFGEPCIVLTPSITIREQWISRIEDAFLMEGVKSEDVLSQDLKDMKWITVCTYQAIHSAMTHYRGKLCDEVEEESNQGAIVEETVDYATFDLIAAINEHHIKTICLDECHHLRNEWWKALETFQKETSLDYTIALTATPPYDSTPELWARYLQVCGEIDEEISVPELVKESNLCPHQDYVYFNYPTKDELGKINEFKTKRDEYCNSLLKDDLFKSIISSHACLKQDADFDKLLEDPAYLSSILIYLNATGTKVSGNFKELLGYTRLEPPSPKWFELLLQGLLYKDSHSYDIDEDTLKKYIHELKLRGLIEKRKVTLQLHYNLKKDLVSSIGKCESIKDITVNEYNSMGKGLRLLILCDYIKKEYKPAVGNLELDVHALGVIPYFELLRRDTQARNSELNLGVLCGSIAIIPSHAKSRLLELVRDSSVISFKPIGALSEQDYVEVEVRGNRHFLTGVITQLFEEGYMEVLIGTKSLLGEGWDSPCVNSLILASFVGSFMLSNQMRGRAIRTYPKNPNKTSNIWHLVCVIPSKMEKKCEQTNQLQLDLPREENQDMEMLSRRMDNFLGLHYEIDSIESGIHRLTAIRTPLDTKGNVEKTNGTMLALSADRATLKSRWERSLLAMNKMEIVDEVCTEEKPATSVLLFDYIRYLIISLISYFLRVQFLPSGSDDLIYELVLKLISLVILACLVSNSVKIIQFLNPLKGLKLLGEGVRQALIQAGKFDGCEHRVEAIHTQVLHQIYLVGGTGHDKAVFAQCMSELLAEVDNQRYILYAPRRKHKKDGYFPVPELFSKRREDAELFGSCLKKYTKDYTVVYTRNPEGRKILLKGRVHAMANKQNRAIQRKRVKDGLE